MNFLQSIQYVLIMRKRVPSLIIVFLQIQINMHQNPINKIPNKTLKTFVQKSFLELSIQMCAGWTVNHQTIKPYSTYHSNLNSFMEYMLFLQLLLTLQLLLQSSLDLFWDYLESMLAFEGTSSFKNLYLLNIYCLSKEQHPKFAHFPSLL